MVIVARGFQKEARVTYYKDDKVFIADAVDVYDDMMKKPEKYESVIRENLAIALDHLSLAAVEEGLGTCWIAGLDERELKEILGVPGDVTAPMAMTVGYPAEQPEARHRKPLEQIVCCERYE